MEVSKSIVTMCSICTCMKTWMTIICRGSPAHLVVTTADLGLDGVMVCMSHHLYIESTESLFYSCKITTG